MRASQGGKAMAVHRKSGSKPEKYPAFLVGMGVILYCAFVWGWTWYGGSLVLKLFHDIAERAPGSLP